MAAAPSSGPPPPARTRSHRGRRPPPGAPSCRCHPRLPRPRPSPLPLRPRWSHGRLAAAPAPATPDALGAPRASPGAAGCTAPRVTATRRMGDAGRPPAGRLGMGRPAPGAASESAFTAPSKRVKGWRREEGHGAPRTAVPGAFDPVPSPLRAARRSRPADADDAAAAPAGGAGSSRPRWARWSGSPRSTRSPVRRSGRASPAPPSGPGPEAPPLTGRAKRRADKAAKAAAAGAAVRRGRGRSRGGPVRRTSSGHDDPGFPRVDPAPGTPMATGALRRRSPSRSIRRSGACPRPHRAAASTTRSRRQRRARPRPATAVCWCCSSWPSSWWWPAIAYFVVKRNNNTTSTTVARRSRACRRMQPLAASINLRQTDLPAGWAATTSTGQARPPVAPAAAQAQASQTLAQCLGVPVATVTGLFAGTGLPGQTASATSPVFESAADPTVQMHSVTRVMALRRAGRSPGRSVHEPQLRDLLHRLPDVAGVRRRRRVHGPGAGGRLTAPTGVQSFGYLTTLTIPSQGSEVIGQAFMVGGRIESVLEPTTAGVAGAHAGLHLGLQRHVGTDRSGRRQVGRVRPRHLGRRGTPAARHGQPSGCSSGQTGGQAAPGHAGR